MKEHTEIQISYFGRKYKSAAELESGKAELENIGGFYGHFFPTEGCLYSVLEIRNALHDLLNNSVEGTAYSVVITHTIILMDEHCDEYECEYTWVAADKLASGMFEDPEITFHGVGPGTPSFTITDADSGTMKLLEAILKVSA